MTSVAEANSVKPDDQSAAHAANEMDHEGYDSHDKAEASELHGSHAFLNALHYGGGTIGTVYRTLLSLGIIGLVITGLLIYQKRGARTQKR